MSKHRYSDFDIAQAVISNVSIAGVLRQIGMAVSTGSYRHIQCRIKRLGLDTTHMLGRGSNVGTSHKGGFERHTATDILVLRAVDYRSKAAMLTRALIEIGRPYTCATGCGCSRTWQGKAITLQVDHINGNCFDDRAENLQFLCPNCHSQTDNWGRHKKQSVKPTKPPVDKTPKPPTVKYCQCGNVSKTGTRCTTCCKKSQEKTTWPDDATLQKMLWEIPATQIAKNLGVSDNAIKHRCNTRGITAPGRGYWAKKKSQMV